MRYEIVLDHGETMNKCTVTPLRDRSDFRFFPVFGEGRVGPLSAPLLLHHEGECLTMLRDRFPTPPDLACVTPFGAVFPGFCASFSGGKGFPPFR